MKEAGGPAKFKKQQAHTERKKVRLVSRLMRTCVSEGLNVDYRLKAELLNLIDSQDEADLINAVTSNDWRLFSAITKQSETMLGVDEESDSERQAEG